MVEYQKTVLNFLTPEIKRIGFRSDKAQLLSLKGKYNPKNNPMFYAWGCF
jgi:hypothetical protein